MFINRFKQKLIIILLSLACNVLQPKGSKGFISNVHSPGYSLFINMIQCDIIRSGDFGEGRKDAPDCGFISNFLAFQIKR